VHDDFPNFKVAMALADGYTGRCIFAGLFAGVHWPVDSLTGKISTASKLYICTSTVHAFDTSSSISLTIGRMFPYARVQNCFPYARVQPLTAIRARTARTEKLLSLRLFLTQVTTHSSISGLRNFGDRANHR